MKMSNQTSPLECGYDPKSIRTYTFPTQSIPRLSVKDPEVFQRIKASLPVVITDSGLVESALKWNLGYLQKNLGDGFHYVYSSKDNKFKDASNNMTLTRKKCFGQYHDMKRVDQMKTYPNSTKRVEVTFSQFIDMLKKRKNSTEKVYLQQTLNRTVGQEIINDFLHFKWDLVKRYQSQLGWGPLSSNLLLIGLEGNITPAHYDEQENIFTQICGYKRCLLFSPDQYECLYPHPVAHPCDRQSQVDFEQPDFERFPKFKDLQGLEAIVGPGDVLYIPMYWWHQVESLTSIAPTDHQLNPINRGGGDPSCGTDEVPPVTISLNFWYRSARLLDTPQYPLSGQQRVSVMRNVEKLLASALGNADEVGRILRTMVEGRYTEE